MSLESFMDKGWLDLVVRRVEEQQEQQVVVVVVLQEMEGL